MRKPLPLRLAFAAAAASFLVTAVVHIVRGLVPAPADPSSPGRHALFVGINLAAALGLLVRPRWFPAPFALLLLQQEGSHGGRAVAALRAGQAPGGEDVAVALFLPVVLGLLLWELRSRSADRPLSAA